MRFYYKVIVFFILMFMPLSLSYANMVLHDIISPGVPEMRGARDSLPNFLTDNQCVIACYTKIKLETLIAGYYLNDGYYSGKTCYPDGYSGDISQITSDYSKKCSILPNCNDSQCWSGGDTRGFYRFSE